MLAGRFREVVKKAYLYSRVSSIGQIDGSGIDRQDERGLEYCNRLIVPTGMPLDSDVRCDKGRSAFKGKHLQEDGALRKILDEIKVGTIFRGSILIVENLDRISRQGPKLARQILARITDYEVEIHIVNINQILKRNWENEFGQSVVVDNELQRAWKESLYKSDRIGKSRAGKKGNADSRAPITKNVPEWLRIEGRLYNGSKFVDPGKIVKIPERAASVREAFRLTSLGVGCKHRSPNRLVSLVKLADSHSSKPRRVGRIRAMQNGGRQEYSGRRRETELLPGDRNPERVRRLPRTN